MAAASQAHTSVNHELTAALSKIMGLSTAQVTTLSRYIGAPGIECKPMLGPVPRCPPPATRYNPCFSEQLWDSSCVDASRTVRNCTRAIMGLVARECGYALAFHSGDGTAATASPQLACASATPPACSSVTSLSKVLEQVTALLLPFVASAVSSELLNPVLAKRWNTYRVEHTHLEQLEILHKAGSDWVHTAVVHAEGWPLTVLVRKLVELWHAIRDKAWLGQAVTMATAAQMSRLRDIYERSQQEPAEVAMWSASLPLLLCTVVTTIRFFAALGTRTAKGSGNTSAFEWDGRASVPAEGSLWLWNDPARFGNGWVLYAQMAGGRTVQFVLALMPREEDAPTLYRAVLHKMQLDTCACLTWLGVDIVHVYEKAVCRDAAYLRRMHWLQTIKHLLAQSEPVTRWLEQLPFHVVQRIVSYAQAIAGYGSDELLAAGATTASVQQEVREEVGVRVLMIMLLNFPQYAVDPFSPVFTALAAIASSIRADGAALSSAAGTDSQGAGEDAGGVASAAATGAANSAPGAADGAPDSDSMRPPRAVLSVEASTSWDCVTMVENMADEISAAAVAAQAVPMLVHLLSYPSAFQQACAQAPSVVGWAHAVMLKHVTAHGFALNRWFCPAHIVTVVSESAGSAAGTDEVVVPQDFPWACVAQFIGGAGSYTVSELVQLLVEDLGKAHNAALHAPFELARQRPRGMTAAPLVLAFMVQRHWQVSYGDSAVKGAALADLRNFWLQCTEMALSLILRGVTVVGVSLWRLRDEYALHPEWLHERADEWVPVLSTAMRQSKAWELDNVALLEALASAAEAQKYGKTVAEVLSSGGTVTPMSLLLIWVHRLELCLALICRGLRGVGCAVAVVEQLVIAVAEALDPRLRVNEKHSVLFGAAACAAGADASRLEPVLRHAAQWLGFTAEETGVLLKAARCVRPGSDVEVALTAYPVLKADALVEVNAVLLEPASFAAVKAVCTSVFGHRPPQLVRQVQVDSCAGTDIALRACMQDFKTAHAGEDVELDLIALAASM